MRGSDGINRRQWIGWSTGILAGPLIGRLAQGQDYRDAGRDHSRRLRDHHLRQR